MKIFYGVNEHHLLVKSIRHIRYELALFIFTGLTLVPVRAANITLSPEGSMTLQQAATQLLPGDTCFLRGGSYHQTLELSGLKGTAAKPILFMSWPGETAVLDGSIPITSSWTLHKDNIYKTTLSKDIWQLFYDGKWMTMARWPNGSVLTSAGWDLSKWAEGDATASKNGLEIDSPKSSGSLAGSKLNATGAMAVLNIGSFITFAKRVTKHAAGSDRFEYDAVPEAAYRDKWHYYYLEGKLDFIDAESEWFYDSSSNELYFYAPGGGEPAKAMRGKDQSFAFDLSGSEYVTLKGLHFFASTYRFQSSKHITVEDCNLQYPSYSQRMLKNDSTILGSLMLAESDSVLSHYTVRNSVFENTDGYALHMTGSNNLIENCLFRNIDFSAANIPSMGYSVNVSTLGTGNVVRRNTIERAGASSTISPGVGGLVEYNKISDVGKMQTDRSAIHYWKPQQPGAVIRYNWVSDGEDVGIRFDGSPGHIDGLMHHNVTIRMGSGQMVKGDKHQVYNNVGVAASGRNDIMVLSGTEFGPNTSSITRNNIADKISGIRTGYAAIPGTDTHNWNGHLTAKSVFTQLRDPNNWDFRPKSGSEIVDKGVVVSGITDGYIGTAPDIGAYEYNDSVYWIPGQQVPKASFPMPRQHSAKVSANTDLIWLQGYKALSHDVYFGTAYNDVFNAGLSSPEFKGNQIGNIYTPSGLTTGKEYYWRIDARGPAGTIKGDVWRFTLDNDFTTAVLPQAALSLQLLSILHPNPSTLIVQLYQTQLENLVVTLHDMQGRQWAEQKISASGMHKASLYSSSPLPRGVYFINIRSPQKQISHKWVKVQ